MIVQITSDGRVELLESDDFKRFKLVISRRAGDRLSIERALAGVARLDGDSTAWISEAALRGWRGVVEDAAWQQGLTRMIERAQPHGWIDAATGMIKAHVEWTD